MVICASVKCGAVSSQPVYEDKPSLTIDFSDSPLTKEWKDRVTQSLTAYADVFAQHNLDFGHTSKVKHHIKLKDQTPFKQKSRPIHPNDYEAVRKHLQALLDAGMIRELGVPYSSPIVVIRKKNGDIRLCIDYRKLNTLTIRDVYALPNLEEAFSTLAGSKWFSVMDLKSGYYQIEMEECDKAKTAFVCPLGFYEFNRMPQGITNAPSTFQRLMEKCMGSLNLKEVLVFLDDVIVLSSTLEEHEARLLHVLQKLREYGLKLSPSKCRFFQTSVCYLGHIVSSKGVETDSEKVSTLRTWPRPQTLKELKSCLGFAGYYCRFVKDYSKIVKPLNDLTKGYPPYKKGKRAPSCPKGYFSVREPFADRWTPACQRAFETVIEKLTSSPVLGFADPKLLYVLHTDASTSGYYQIEMEECDKAKTAFVCPLGFYEFNRMPQGITNAPSTFQRLMEKCMGSLNLKEVLVFLDDVIVLSSTLEEHEARLLRVLQKLREYGLKLSPSKCRFFQTSVCYLGHMVSSKGVETDSEKVSTLRTWSRPQTLKELKSFLGFAGYYRRFVKDYSKIVKPLNDLTKGYPPYKKGKRAPSCPKGYFSVREPFADRWTPACQRAFETVIEKLTSSPVLGFADPKLLYVLHTDASTSGLGAALYQEQDGDMRVIAYPSRGLSPSEKRYPAHKLEFLVLKCSIVENFQDYLYGNTFTVIMDNNPLTYLLKSAKLDATSYRWLAALSMFDFNIKYHAGKCNQDADGLSRWPHDTLEDDHASLEEKERMKQFASHHLSSSLDQQDVPSETVRALYHCHLLREADNNLPSITLVESLALHAEAVPHAYEDAGLGCPTIPTYTEAELQPHQRSDPVIGPVRIHFKSLLFVYKGLHGLAPSYISDLLFYCNASRELRSTSSLQLTVPRTRLKLKGDHAFSVAAPQLWNNLPFYIRSAPTYADFKSLLKTYLFTVAYGLK